MHLTQVTTKKDKKDFLNVARVIYANDSNWVCPLDAQINSIFDPEENIFYKNGEAERWILKNDKGELIGRVATFINRNKAFGYEQPTGGMGFFECINDKEAAFKLFDKCKEWLSERKMEAMDGPINFGENDNFWGLLVDGFTQPGFGMNYNFKYYKELFEEYGFNFYYEQVSHHLEIAKSLPERFWKVADWVINKAEYNFKHYSIKNSEKFLKDIIEIYQDAWQFHENFTPAKLSDLRIKFDKMKDFIIEDFIWFAYHHDEPIAFLVMLPDTNQILKHFNGKINFLGKIKFAWLRSRKKITRARIVIMGVKVKYQRYGIDSGIFRQMQKIIVNHQEYKEIEISWTGDYNPKVKALIKALKVDFAKRHITYRKLFDENAKSKRSKIIPVDTRK
ncbi:MAG: GNAT family N-acetyltransferase [Bacteroidota bacterium]|nr:GNAT family N-acetyltransferase [Bacteroidota bacterium]